MIAIYLGARTIVVGKGGISWHKHTRGTCDKDQAAIGVRRLKRVEELKPCAECLGFGWVQETSIFTGITYSVGCDECHGTGIHSL